MREQDWLGYPKHDRKPPSKLAWFVGVIVLLILAASANAQVSGVLSLTQECTTNCRVDFRIAPASAVSVGQTSTGSVVLTAKHCVDVKTNRFYVSGPDNRKVPAVVVYRHPSLDIAVLHASKKFRNACQIRMTNPRAGEKVTLKGVLSGRFQEASGTLLQIDRGRAWSADVWSHPGMSGGGMYDSDGRLFGIHGASVVGENKTIASGAESIRDCLQAVERRYGKVMLAKGSIQTQQGSPRLGMRANGQVCRKCGDPNCQVCNATRAVDCVPATVAIPRQEIDYAKAADIVFERYGNRLRGTDGKTPQLNLDELADVITSRYADRIRGQRGNDGQPGQRGEKGPAGTQGPRGLVGVPDDVDIRNWLIGASSDPATREMLAAVFADIVAADPRTQDLIERLEALERQGVGQTDDRFLELAKRLDDFEKRVVPVIVNYDGKEFTSAPKRQAFDPIVINVPAKQ